MELDKIRNLGDSELAVERNKAAEQLFRVRFQLKLGQTDVVEKVRGLRKEIARIKTVARERELGLRGAAPMAESSAPAKKAHVSKARRGAPAPAKKAPAKKAAKKSTTKKEAR
jgi:large subunit ribosomal protein L29